MDRKGGGGTVITASLVIGGFLVCIALYLLVEVGKKGAQVEKDRRDSEIELKKAQDFYFLAKRDGIEVIKSDLSDSLEDTNLFIN